MKITVAKYEFVYGDTDICAIQDELKALAEEAARCEGEEFDVCYKREVEKFNKALKDYVTILEITKSDIEYEIEKTYGKVTDIKIENVKCFQELSRYRRSELMSSAGAFKVRDILCEHPDEGEATICLDEDADLCIEVQVSFRNEDGESDYDFFEFKPSW